MISNTTTSEIVFLASSAMGSGLQGESTSDNGVIGNSSSGAGVFGFSNSGFGVDGVSNTSVGVRGVSVATDKPATVGWSRGSSSGLLGYSNNGSGALPAAKPKTGVYGYANQDSSATGVLGQSGSGNGVQGLSGGGIGVFGHATAASGATFGMFARTESPAGVAMAARAAGHGTGVLGMSGTGTFPAARAKTAVYGYAAQDNNAKGVWGHSPAGRGIQGSTTTGYAGYFSGKVFSTKFYELAEIATAPAPATNRARLFVRDNGAGKTQLCVASTPGPSR